MKTHDILVRAKAAAPELAALSADKKNEAIFAMADSLTAAAKEIMDANAVDMDAAKGRISDVMLDRLALNPARIDAMASGMREVAALPDPVWQVLSGTKRPNGMVIEKISVPLGVTAIIYESRPNVTSDAAVLSFKSGNVCVLRSGKEAWNSANAVTNALRRGLAACGLKEDFIS
ncbi:MAG: gamma-glutamyl-phosphate reductase, partial [Clostridiales bacterium]|nr:gamma-glutamyl-phosphate reductase [Clostridiales bacterium]